MDAQSETEQLSEGKQLAIISGGKAKGILLQLGYFDPDTIFLSLRFTKEQFEHLQESLALHSLTPEQLISSLCEQDVLDEHLSDYFFSTEGWCNEFCGLAAGRD